MNFYEETKMKINLADLPLRYQLQAQREMKNEKPSQIAQEPFEARGGVKPCADTPKAVVSNPEPKTATKKRRQPNKTEAEYNRTHLGSSGKYEGITLRLPGGSRYTPDWVTTVDGRITLHEVKGSYRFGSHGRAVTAFRECAAAWPEFKFVWATRQKSGEWKIDQWS